MDAASKTAAQVEQRYTLSQTVRSTHRQDGAVVLEIQRGRMYSVNRLGSRVLELLKSARSESEIADVITREFEVSREKVEKDLRGFVTILTQQKLIEACSSDSATSLSPTG